MFLITLTTVAIMLAYAASRAEVPPAAGETVEAEADTYRAPRPKFGMFGRRAMA